MNTMNEARAWLERYGRPGDLELLERALTAANRTGDEVVEYTWTDGDGSEDGPMSLGWALACNLEDDYVVEQLLGLEVGGEYTIGGGAAPELTVRRLS